MKKLIVSLAAIGVLAIAPSSAFAVSQWGGWGQQHYDNVASANYPGDFGNNGLGNTDYCVAPLSSTDPGEPAGDNDDTCDGPVAVSSPVVFTGIALSPVRNGCTGHETSTGKDGSGNVTAPVFNALGVGAGPTDPCSSGDSLGAFYVGFSDTSPVDPGQGIIGLQG